jgi:hypothetical protein
MRVYRLATDGSRYQTFATLDDAAAPALRTDGTRIGSAWCPPLVQLSEPGLRSSDFLSFPACSMILSPRARSDLGSHLQAGVEVLPLWYSGREYSLINVTNVIDCLDPERSVTYPYVKNYAFHRECLSRMVHIELTGQGRAKCRQ